MLFLITILSVLAAIVLLSIFVKRQVAGSLAEHESLRELPEPQYRPLFEPTAEELQAEQLQEAAKEAEIDSRESLKQTEEKLASFDHLRQNWANSPNRAGTIELLYQASALGRVELYWDTCERVLAVWRAGTISGLSADDLAQMLESHFWLLRDSERTPGVSFHLKEEIAGLRREFAESK
ncbi:MAG: hypothetical protein ABI878_04080 [Acidobacteriota bacterium]